jgi:hypothetical protein
MAMVRCDANEHHYDNSKHSSCPHCTSGRGNDDKTSIINRKRATGGGSRPTPKDAPEKETVIKDKKQDSGPKTVAPWARKKKVEESSTELKSAYSEAPVVGWLVITEGLQKGRDFRIIPGINKIGRNDSNTINIDNGDTEISREGHCLIEYDLKSGQFYLERGATSTYHNDGRVGGNGNELALGDTIQIGSTTLKFIPFCNSDFCWEM